MLKTEQLISEFLQEQIKLKRLWLKATLSHQLSQPLSQSQPGK